VWLERLLTEAIDSSPAACPGGAGLRDLILMEAEGFLPKELARRAA
jgi:hypothetical protein